jgi:hypothetical protein
LVSLPEVLSTTRAVVGVGLLVRAHEDVGGSHWKQGEEGEWRRPEAAEEEKAAKRAWVAAGGSAAVAREMRLLGNVEECRAAARVVTALEAKGGLPSANLRRIANGRQVVGLRMAVRRRAVVDGEMDAGMRPDGRGRWAVERVIEWKVEGGVRWALVSWMGFDKATDEPWGDSWVRESWLTQDLRKRRSEKESELEGAVVQVAKVAKGSRVSPRLAGEMPVGGLA